MIRLLLTRNLSKVPPGAVVLASFLLLLPLAGRTSEDPGPLANSGKDRNPVQLGGPEARDPEAAPAVMDTLWFGGTTWDPMDMRWEALPDSVWTFETGVGSSINTDPLAKSVGFHRTMEGWSGHDFTDRSESLRFLRRTTLCALSGSWSLHAGATEAEADSLCWVAGQGYGNNLAAQASKTFAYPGSGSITLQYAYAVNAEAGYDYAYVLIDTTGNGSAGPVLIGTHTGVQSGTASLALNPGTAQRSTPGPFTLLFQFVSDPSYSDQDGLYTTACGHSTIDNISLSGALVDLSTFEGGANGWTVESPEVISNRLLNVGDWSDLEAIVDLPDPGAGNPCSFEDSVLVFLDPSMGAGGGHPFDQDNLALSPWIELDEQSLLPPYDLIIEYEGHFDLPLLDNVFVHYALQWSPLICTGGGTPASEIMKQGILDYSEPGGILSTSECNPPVRRFFPDVIPAGATAFRIGIGVVNQCLSFPFGDCTEVSNDTPWIDNVRAGVVGTQPTSSVPPTGAPRARPIFETPRPNPVTTSTSVALRFALPRRGAARIDVYDVSGRLVRRVLDGTVESGWTEATWDTRDDGGRNVASGLYFVRFTAAGGSETRKIVIKR